MWKVEIGRTEVPDQPRKGVLQTPSQLIVGLGARSCHLTSQARKEAESGRIAVPG
jgi:hypothetical protein